MKPKFKHLAEVLAAAGVLVLCAGLPAWAQNPKLNLGNLGKLADKADEVVDVTLDGPTLKFAQKFIESDENEKDDAEALKIIRNLTGVYVKSFEFDKPDQYSDADVDAIREQLKAPGWSKLVDVHSKKDHELDEVYLMTGPSGKNLGLAVISAERDQLTVVNIVGPIDMDHLADLEGKLGIPSDLDLKGDKGGHHAH
ncbi:MAG TPA: DUF4252 domain-containing protein [Terriglobia bacterium]|nr:DUF4252 domain-containing protein [Terriglobia bacterium]